MYLYNEHKVAKKFTDQVIENRIYSEYSTLLEIRTKNQLNNIASYYEPPLLKN